MANYTFGSRTICPFYLKEARKSITCEGLVDGTMSMTRFASEEEKQHFQGARCARYNYDALCPIAAALMQKHEKKEHAEKKKS